jgi:hypothetical protein
VIRDRTDLRAPGESGGFVVVEAKMARTGRPPTLNEDVQKKITDAIRLGNYIETAAAYAGVPKRTLYDWLKRGALAERKRDEGLRLGRNDRLYLEFSHAVERALADSEMHDVLLIHQAAKDAWQAAAWRLERKFPDRWGRRIQATVNATVATSEEYDEADAFGKDEKALALADALAERLSEVDSHEPEGGA